MEEEKFSKEVNLVLPQPNKLSATFIDFPEPTGIALIVYFTGCEHNCSGCQNPELQDINFSNAEKFSITKLVEILNINSIKQRTKKIVLSGGDPLHPENIEFTKHLLKKTYHVFDYCIYTGYDIKYIKQNDIRYFKYIITNNFDIECKTTSKKTDDYFQLASLNQDVYNSHLELISNNGKIIF